MLIDHGGIQKADHPSVHCGRKFLDFGCGFYTTDDYEQAVRWAKIKTRRAKSLNVFVNTYSLDGTVFSKLRVLSFDKPDRNWLRFVTMNRKGFDTGEVFDVVRGPIANDTTITVINSFLAGLIDEDVAIALLKPQRLKTQYLFHTERSLRSLKFLECFQL